MAEVAILSTQSPVETDWEQRQLRVLRILAQIYLRLPADKKAAIMAEVTGTNSNGESKPMDNSAASTGAMAVNRS